MFIIQWKDASNVMRNKEVVDLDLALAIEYAKKVNLFVSIKGNGIELVGIFGAAGIENNILPDGNLYTWKKRRSR